MVWPGITRAKYCRDGLRYASDTTDEEWAMIAPHMPCKNRRGRPRVTEMRALVSSIFFIAQSGCQWRLLPKEFPPYTTVQRYFYRWRDDGTWQKINHHLVHLFQIDIADDNQDQVFPKYILGIRYQKLRPWLSPPLSKS